MEKPFLIGVATGAVLATALLWPHSAQQSRQITKLENQVHEKTSALDQQRRDMEDIKTKNEAYVAEATQLRNKLQAFSAPAAEGAKPEETSAPSEPAESPAPEKKGLGGFLEKMLKDPEMKKAMQAQQSIVLKQFYADLMKELHLAPADEER